MTREIVETLFVSAIAAVGYINLVLVVRNVSILAGKKDIQEFCAKQLANQTLNFVCGSKTGSD
ncbi:MAG TPA: hypothetical protein DCM07_22240 [Planctomycetaceae bacterium]|uniref:hypothetical protein n=1 Tax=Gimesia sp. TaxID=2024833 RepID=UPI000C3EFECE|nr:hypothetical protein [Gimesia sp.]MAX36941.1 hypothetical protein [Gimesia sp.]HAH47530.1 hypothetical protein [Planctomycetaceae bacterium]|tara:strand:- start:47 stop:235 length:189 start_codon:yes stop_codon:yes gene_type:complete